MQVSRWNKSISVTFNDNDGKVGWTVNPSTVDDLHRHHYIFGVWRTRWILFKRFWRALVWFENYANGMVAIAQEPKPLWVLNPEIPE
jgi:hypothetical protein